MNAALVIVVFLFLVAMVSLAVARWLFPASPAEIDEEHEAFRAERDYGYMREE